VRREVAPLILQTVGLLAIAMTLAVSGCSGSDSPNVSTASPARTPPAEPSSTASAPPTTSAPNPSSARPTQAPSSQTPAIASPTTGGDTITASDGDNGGTLSLNPGQRLRVVLDSTYWTFNESSNPQVLRLDGQPSVSPQPSGCVPGAGCGTTTATYVAVSDGTAVVTATRTSCGEAEGCTGASGQYSVQVVVRS
jgi:hypothetical protein